MLNWQRYTVGQVVTKRSGRTWASAPRSRYSYAAAVLLMLPLAACRAGEPGLANQPRDQSLPAFTPPHVPPFKCQKSSSPATPIDPQAKAWFDEAATLEAAGRDKVDWKRVAHLKERAAAHGYWPAVKEAIHDYAMPAGQKLAQLKAAMRAGEPEAFFMMGERYMKGDGVERNPDRAYALWQKAAGMGEARAMTQLAIVLSTKQNNSIGWDLVNIPVATSMLECAMANAYGDAAVPLSDIVGRPRGSDGTFSGPPTDASKARGLAVLQEGVKLGSREAAASLAGYFAAMNFVTPCPVLAMRSRYYRFLGASLDEKNPVRLPNLDAAVPLPPAPLPDWRDDENIVSQLWDVAVAPANSVEVLVKTKNRASSRVVDAECD